ncbi:hypothetical protein COSO111634_23735 [Corallococcus soli]
MRRAPRLGRVHQPLGPGLRGLHQRQRLLRGGLRRAGLLRQLRGLTGLALGLRAPRVQPRRLLQGRTHLRLRLLRRRPRHLRLHPRLALRRRRRERRLRLRRAGDLFGLRHHAALLRGLHRRHHRAEALRRAHRLQQRLTRRRRLPLCHRPRHRDVGRLLLPHQLRAQRVPGPGRLRVAQPRLLPHPRGLLLPQLDARDLPLRVRHQRDGGEPVRQPRQLLLLQRVLLVRRDGQPAVHLRARHPLQQLRALVRVRAQERRELPLREQRRAAELVEGQPQPLLNRLEHLALGAAVELPRGHVREAQLLRPEAPFGALARPPHVPARAVAPPVLAQEVHLRVALARAPPEHAAHVVGRQARLLLLVRAPHQHLAGPAQPGRAIKQRQAQRIQQRALARARRAGDGEQPQPVQRRLVQLQLELPGEAREVAAANRQDLHGASSCTWVSSAWNDSSSSGVGGSLKSRAYRARNTSSGVRSRSDSPGRTSASAPPVPV